ncbi:cytosolic iron-sulfur assembly component 3 [Trichonephila clavipes]|nr:cytosolic iron-sulfur assembly component 3 [Trichonephila clavipes]
MVSMFSGVLQLTDLNDFITPSQECVKPIKIEKRDKGGSVIVTDDGDYFETNADGSKEKLERAKITLNDCLACSGCITSAESVLITQQSQEELYRVIEENKKYEMLSEKEKIKTLVVSISPQSRASLAVKYNLDIETTAKKLTAFFHRLGAKLVLDTTLSREFSLIESQKEFIRRYKAKDSESKALPMLSSACPGWICYAEKTHGDYVLPYISTVKSPQQIMGSLVKDYLASKLQLRYDQIYHVSVMPCFDKKLEASRNDFHSNDSEIREVDCVLTSVEVDAMLQTENICLNDLPSVDLDKISADIPIPSEIYSHSGSTSGGYSDHIFLHAAKELFGETISEIQYKILRNQDLKEVILERNGEVLLRFAIANGFRNIQNIIQKLKRGKSPYHFVEIMACPAGCANGGAQIRSENESPKDVLTKVEELYYSLPVKIQKKIFYCQVIYSHFGLAIHQNDHQARRRFVEWAENEIAVVPDFHKLILFSDEAHFWLNGYVNKQNCRIWSEANPQVYVETPFHPEKLTVWCALWTGGIIDPYFKNDEGHNVTVMVIGIEP